MKQVKVGSPVPPPSALKTGVSKRLSTLAEACEVATSAADGVLAALQKYEAMVSVMSTREQAAEVLETIAPLTAVVVLAKKALRCAPESGGGGVQQYPQNSSTRYLRSQVPI